MQFAPAAKLVPQLLANTNEEAFVPVRAMLKIVKVAPPVLVKVTACDAVELPTGSEPYDRLVAESVTVVFVPVPVSATFCGEPLALSVIVIAAVIAPVVAGAKCPWMVQFAPTAKLVPQLLAKTNGEASAPVTLMLVRDMATPPLFVMVTDCDALVDPTSTEPKERLEAERDTSGN